MSDMDNNEIIQLEIQNFYYDIGVNYYINKKYIPALKYFVQAIKNIPNLEYASPANLPYLPKIYYKICNCLINLQDYKKAKEIIEHVIIINPRDADAYYNLGCCFIELEEYAEAKGSFEKALELTPNDTGILKQIIYCSTIQKADKEIIADILHDTTFIKHIFKSLHIFGENISSAFSFVPNMLDINSSLDNISPHYLPNNPTSLLLGIENPSII